jgi:hypothetical protein
VVAPKGEGSVACVTYPWKRNLSQPTSDKELVQLIAVQPALKKEVQPGSGGRHEDNRIRARLDAVILWLQKDA